jgi:hypothetical protein
MNGKISILNHLKKLYNYFFKNLQYNVVNITCSSVVEQSMPAALPGGRLAGTVYVALSTMIAIKRDLILS